MSEVVVVPPPEIDPTTAASFGEDLAATAEADDVRVDFGGVTFCDSSGIRELVIAFQRQVGGGGSLLVINASDRIRRLFDIAGLADRFLPDAPD